MVLFPLLPTRLRSQVIPSDLPPQKAIVMCQITFKMEKKQFEDCNKNIYVCE